MTTLTGAGIDIDPILQQAVAPSNVALSDIVSALSFALDLTEGAMPGHAVRTCLLGMRMAEALGLPKDGRADLYYALLLKDVGCSSNAARLSEIVGGDGLKPNRHARVQHWMSVSWPAMRSRWGNVLPGGSPLAKLRRLKQISETKKQNHGAMIAQRASRGAAIVAKIGLSERTAESIRHLDEHWDGGGYPGQLHGQAIPLGARIVSVAQCLDVFHTEQGAIAAMRILRKRSGSWFDPRLVKLVQSMHREGRLWKRGGDDKDRAMVLELDPGLAVVPGKGFPGIAQQGIALQGITRDDTSIEIDSVCEAFADVVDAKSSFTYEHSMGVTRAASMIAQQMGLTPERQRLVYRAALLHDIGKLRVPNSILDKPGKLDADEWMVIREHPLLTQRILERIDRFDQIARTASQHHERLDGSGYPHGLQGEQISIEARVIAVADVYGALSEDRPYRPALGIDEIMSIMSREVPEKLDAACFAALRGALKRTGGAVSSAGEKILSGTPVSAAKGMPATIAVA